LRLPKKLELIIVKLAYTMNKLIVNLNKDIINKYNKINYYNQILKIN